MVKNLNILHLKFGYFHFIYTIEIKSVKKWPPPLSPLNENKTQVTSQFMKGHEVATRLTGRKLGPLELMGPVNWL